jgi:hypothetical protein
MARLTRREVTLLLAAAPLAAQTTAPPQTKASFRPAPKTVQEASQQAAETSQKLRSFNLPMSVEPAFTFKV